MPAFLNYTLMPSSVIAHMNYDPVTATLRIHFISGSVYEYLQVPMEEYQAMRKAYSKGTYLNVHIKGKYAYKKMQP